MSCFASQASFNGPEYFGIGIVFRGVGVFRIIWQPFSPRLSNLSSACGTNVNSLLKIRNWRLSVTYLLHKFLNDVVMGVPWYLSEILGSCRSVLFYQFTAGISRLKWKTSAVTDTGTETLLVCQIAKISVRIPKESIIFANMFFWKERTLVACSVAVKLFSCCHSNKLHEDCRNVT